MNKVLEGQKVIITGGTRGIGLAIAKCFAEQGADLALFSTNSEVGVKAQKEVEGCATAGQKVKYYSVDVSSAAQVEEAIKTVYEEFGTVDVLINNAGITRDALLMKLKEEDWHRVLDINLSSVYNTCRTIVRPMMKARLGKIINITSVVGIIGNAGQTNYAASKSGMIGFTKSLAKEIGGRGISVNCIAPGFIKTEMTDALSEKQKEMLLSQIPMGRLGEPTDIADTALFLASPQARYITGQVLTVDGGMVM
ncbi:MAG: 3-oxoacyl-[acyl-carrier-protein] reductase FabG [Chlamydiales bacterium]|nr:3-oxoacyl-[acyl-carrier-protein] reductase FabG [Chlamydiales bacterium]MCH9620146.1 3-oxoacyl-[acyl-carrier-protein] reductase FabG [Chlamydiales bacterium]MCH9623616.1 3-oxoacyl-[acyl-carrier-protein] reductase FabG [Chlamydiales bacterium]